MSEAPVPRPPAGPARSAEFAASADQDTRFDHLLHGLEELADRPVGEHHDRLAEVHETLHAALNEPPAPTGV